jgi:serine/threonine protein kinase
MGDCQSKAAVQAAVDVEERESTNSQQNHRQDGGQIEAKHNMVSGASNNSGPTLINVDSEDVVTIPSAGTAVSNSPTPKSDPASIIAAASWLEDWTTMPSKLIDSEEANIPLFEEKEFLFLKRLGMGAFGRVIQVLRKSDQRMFALKIVDKKRVYEKHGSSYVYRLYLERKLLRTIDHPFFTKLEGVYKLKHLMMFLVELAPCGTLKQVLESQEKFEEENARLYAAQILLVITYLHKMSIVHRDLRPDNVLVALDGYLRVTDIGIAAELPKDYQIKRTSSGRSLHESIEENKAETNLVKSNSPSEGKGKEVDWSTVKTPSPKRLKRGESVTGAPLVTVVGAAGWKPPEMQKSQGYDYGADFWNFGVLLYMMLIGKHPFTSFMPTADLDKAVLKQTKVAFPKNISPEARDLIKKLLEPDPVKRLGSSKNLNGSASLTETSVGDSARPKSTSLYTFKQKSLSQSVSSPVGRTTEVHESRDRIVSETDEKKIWNFEIQESPETRDEPGDESKEDRFPGDGLEIRNHSFFKGVDWESLEKKVLRMPVIETRVPLTVNHSTKPEYQNLEEVMKEFDNRDVALQLENMMFMA